MLSEVGFRQRDRLLIAGVGHVLDEGGVVGQVAQGVGNRVDQRFHVQLLVAGGEVECLQRGVLLQVPPVRPRLC